MAENRNFITILLKETHIELKIFLPNSIDADTRSQMDRHDLYMGRFLSLRKNFY
jgi:hypothetical protein